MTIIVECNRCKESFDVLVSYRSDADQKCPKCGAFASVTGEYDNFDEGDRVSSDGFGGLGREDRWA